MKIIYGPPGTGKTTHLLNLVREYLDASYPVESIGYLSFTRRAAREASSRIATLTNQDVRSFVNFRTLHSLAYRGLGINRSQLISQKHLQIFGDQVGYEIRGSSDSGEGSITGSLPGDKMLFMQNLCRIKEEALDRIYAGYDDQVGWFEFRDFSRAYEIFKENYHLLDYTDILEQFNTRNPSLPIKVLFVDEAQDLSRLQWDIIRNLSRQAEETYVAGDDDQAIYQWAGASIEDFLGLEGEKQVLERSYRVPSEIKAVADSISGAIRQRQPKDFTARLEHRDERNRVLFEPTLDGIDFSAGTWLLLARNGYLLTKYREELDARGLGYNDDGRIQVSTIHSAKGAEADSVVLTMDMARRTYEEFTASPDPEHRVWYVGATRARGSLYILEPESPYCYEV